MTVQHVIEVRDIQEVLHFTTHLGLVGILDSKAVKSRKRLERNKRLEHILRLNTNRVLDPAWVDYVNLSITRINMNLFDISSISWHPDVWWLVLAFDPIIMTHEGVHFVTTNNAYHQHLRRGQGPEALESLFEPNVKGRYGVTICRTHGMPACCTTCVQAEVLYPRELSTDYLRRIYVSKEEDQDDVYGQQNGLSHPEVDVIVDPNKFRDHVG